MDTRFKHNHEKEKPRGSNGRQRYLFSSIQALIIYIIITVNFLALLHINTF